MVAKVDFEVTGEEKMHCNACETRVRFALSRLAGVQEVSANARKQHIAVLINPDQTTPQAVQARLKDAGFEVTLRNV